MAAVKLHAPSLFQGTTAERNATSLPASLAGSRFWDTDEGKPYFWSGSEWVSSGAGGGLPGPATVFVHDDSAGTVIKKSTVTAAFVTADPGDMVVAGIGDWAESLTLTEAIVFRGVSKEETTVTGLTLQAAATVEDLGCNSSGGFFASTSGGGIWRRCKMSVTTGPASRAGWSLNVAQTLEDCEADVSGGGTANYGVALNAGTGYVVRRGRFAGTTASLFLGSGVTCEVYGAWLPNGIAGTGTATGWYLDANLNLVSLGGKINFKGVNNALILDAGGAAAIDGPSANTIRCSTGGVNRLNISNAGIALQSGITVNEIASNNNANAVVARDANSDVSARLFRPEYNAAAPSFNYINVQNARGTGDNYIRAASLSEFKSRMGLAANTEVMGHRAGAGYYAQQGSTSKSNSGGASFTLWADVTNTSVTFPVAFSSTPIVVSSTDLVSLGGVGVKSVTTTGFQYRVWASATPVTVGIQWVAIGT